jgi:hypothetical protein
MSIFEVSNDFRTFVARVRMVIWKDLESVGGEKVAINVRLEGDGVLF